MTILTSTLIAILRLLLLNCLALSVVSCSIAQYVSEEHFKINGSDEILFPKLKSVSEMTFEQVLDILQLYHNPEHTNLASKQPDALVTLIVYNFYYGHVSDVSSEEAANRRRKGVRHIRYNQFVLSQMEKD